MRKSAVLEWGPGAAIVGPIPLFALHGGDVVNERIGCKRGSKSGAGHLHQRELLRIDAGGGVLDLKELLLDAAAQGGGGEGFAGFKLVIGLEAEGLCRRNGQSVE